ncbi:MAG: galactose-1-phosphate uridylyltransferase [Candidatus Omnitrophota bacterium]
MQEQNEQLELRRDPVVGRWIIINYANEMAPSDFKIVNEKRQIKVCPFCYGNEDKTPPEIYAERNPDTKPNTTGWNLRVIPNKFPALRIEGELNRHGLGVYDLMNGVGAHEVIVETPNHNEEMADYDPRHLERIIWAYYNRANDLKKDKRFKYILFFKNYGMAAGASLEHPHTQLIALPIIPKRVREYIISAQAYYNYKERCVYCDIINEEDDVGLRKVYENDKFVAFCPYASCQPFETWIIPKRHCANFSHITKEEIPGLADVLKRTLLKIKKVLNDPPYNFIINTAPIDDDLDRPDYHWHFEIVPKLVHIAGFEWGTGFYINPTPPEKAAAWLREVEV